jgi:uridine kinase
MIDSNSSDFFSIAVSGSSGSGKSSLVKELSNILPDSVTLFFDEYRPDYDKLTADLATLKKGHSITHPLTATVVEPARFIILEEPYGRTRSGMSSLVDFLIFIETPLEICLARVLLRAINDSLVKDFQSPHSPLNDGSLDSINPDLLLRDISPDKTLDTVSWLLENYLTHHRQQYLDHISQLIPDSDLVLDGTLPIDILAAQALDVLNSRF